MLDLDRLQFLCERTITLADVGPCSPPKDRTCLFLHWFVFYIHKKSIMLSHEAIEQNFWSNKEMKLNQKLFIAPERSRRINLLDLIGDRWFLLWRFFSHILAISSWDFFLFNHSFWQPNVLFWVHFLFLAVGRNRPNKPGMSEALGSIEPLLGLIANHFFNQWSQLVWVFLPFRLIKSRQLMLF